MIFYKLNNFHTEAADILYSMEEWNCLMCPEQMTQEVFEKCLDTCAATCNLEEYIRICDLFPHFAQVYMNHVEKLMTDMKQAHQTKNT